MRLGFARTARRWRFCSRDRRGWSGDRPIKWTARMQTLDQLWAAGPKVEARLGRGRVSCPFLFVFVQFLGKFHTVFLFYSKLSNENSV